MGFLAADDVGLRADGSHIACPIRWTREQRDGERGDSQPERTRDARTVEAHGVLRERRNRLSQQQRARDDRSATTAAATPPTGDAPRASKGAEVGVRTVAIPHLQSTVSIWALRLGSELVYNGDIGATEPGPASKRYGVEVANYYSPKPWLVFDGDVSWSQARFAEFRPAALRSRGRRRRGVRWGQRGQLS